MARQAKPYPPRWVKFYMLFLLTALIVWIILNAIHSGPPWVCHW